MKVVYPEPDHRVTGPPKQCDGKHRYLFRQQAERAMVIVNNVPGNASAYLCPHCRYWHWGRDRGEGRR